MGKWCLRIGLALGGTALISLAAAVNYLIGLGSDPYQVFMVGLHTRMDISYGTANIIMNALISLALLFFARKYLKLSLLLAVFASGPMTDGMVALLEGALSPALPLWTRLALAVLSCLTLGLGVYLYLLPELGASPADSVGLVLSDLTRLPYRYTRWMTDGLYTLLGWMLGGVVGVNTLLTCLCTGPVIGLYERLLGNTRIARTVRGFCPPAEKK
ncbi:MAG: YczE/YyaS/YitT family protein [Christensenellales bacterium]|jgi:uncharacterized membrane protein YczE